MHFFVDSPSVLGGTQTFVASVAALIVLCLFRDSSNFLMTLISSLNGVLYREAVKKAEELQKQQQTEIPNYKRQRGRPSTEEQTVYKAFTNLKLEMNDFVVKVNSLIHEYEGYRQKQERRDEPRYMSIFMFIVVIAVLTFDSFCISADAGALLLWSVNWFTAVFSVMLWKHYSSQYTKYYIRLHAGLWRNVTYVSMFVITSIIVLTLMWLQPMQMGVALGVASLLLGILIHDGITYMQMVDRLNDKFIVKYGICLLTASLAVFVIYSVAYYQSWLADSISSEAVQQHLAQWCSNVSWLTATASQARSVFVALLVVNAFIAPLVIAYLQNRKEYNHVNSMIEAAYNDSHAKIILHKQAYLLAKESLDSSKEERRL